MPGTINVSGLASGIDFNATVDKLIAVERRPITLLENKKADEIARQNALADLNSLMLTLRTSAQNMADASSFLVNSSTLTATSTTGNAVDPATILSVTAGSNALAGSHTVTVTQIASAEKLGSTGAILDSAGGQITSTTQPLGLSGTFQIKGQAAAAQSVTIATGDSLQDIANKINKLNSGANATGISASTLMVASGDFRLVLSSSNTGTSATTQSGRIGEVLIDSNGDLANAAMLGKLNLDPANTAIELQISANATLTIDGVTGITRSSNSISDALSGLTLNLKNADTNTTVTIGTAVDQAAVKSKIQDFVDAFNAVQSFVTTQMTFDSKTQTSGVLASDSLVRGIQSQLASSVQQMIPGLAAGVNNMVLVGVAPDSTGQLVIDDARLTSLLSTDPTAVRNVFSATGVGSSSSIEFINYGANTISGTYAVNVTTAATQAAATGSVDLSAGITGSDKISIVDSGGQKASFTLTGGVGNNGENLSSIVSALNAEFGKTYAEVRHQNSALKIGSAGAFASSSTFLSALTDGAGTSMNVEAGDSITISGTDRLGATVNGTFTVINPTTDSVNDILSSIESAFGNQVAASIDASGQITITDNQTGGSNLTLNLTANDAGGSLALGLSFSSGETVTTEGRYAMQLKAEASGTNLKVGSNAFGSGTGFSIDQIDPSTSAVVDLLGFGNTSGAPTVTVASGVGIAGTIDGQAATGIGQVLTGTAGSVDGLVLRYTGSAATSSPYPTINVSLGLGAIYDNLLDGLANPATGLIQGDVLSSQGIIDNLVSTIADMNTQLQTERDRLTAQFVSMEVALGRMKSTSQFLSQQISRLQ